MYGDNKSRLVENLGNAPSSEWVDSYLNLVDSLLSGTNLTRHDPRLVMSLPKEGTLPVTVNNRYVLTPFREERSRTEFILPANRGAVDEYLNEADRTGRFDAIYDEEESNRPWFVGFDGLPDRIVDDEFERLWLSAVRTEMQRAERSPYRRYDEPILYRAARDPGFRGLVIRDAFD
ncbi:hypothetical protein [Haloarchaeobius sp. HRN-SO-5]|uniref:hypothetical protein n=1 Tax=Haloarchaeobius sp. HRN-SO-5 TaxID=3446118 RepID=UPI003EB956D0